MDDTATTATPPSSSRASLHSAPALPSHTPNTLAHTGTTAERPAKSTAYKFAAERARATSFRHQLFRDRLQSPPHFFEHQRKIQRQHRLFRIDDHIHRARALQYRTPLPNRFPHTPFDPVAHHRAAKHLANS